MRTAQLAVSMAGLDVIGVGLGGDEARLSRRSSSSTPSRSRARKVCIRSRTRAKPPVPRACAPRWKFSARERIGHGIRALEIAVVELLRAGDSARNLPDVERAHRRGAPRRSRIRACDLDAPAASSRSTPTIRRMFRHARSRTNTRWSNRPSGSATLQRYRRATPSTRVRSRRAQSELHARALGARNPTRRVEARANMSGHTAISPSRPRSISRRSTVSSARARASRRPALASELGVAPASVSGMLKKLADDGYIEYVARGEVKLTRDGLEVARARDAPPPAGGVLAHRHPRDAVGRSARGSVPARARDLERVEQRLVDVLGDPKTCPHGHPIPPADLSDPSASACRSRKLEAGGERRRVRRHRRSSGDVALSWRDRVAARRASERRREGAAGRPGHDRDRRARVTRSRSNSRAWSS